MVVADDRIETRGATTPRPVLLGIGLALAAAATACQGFFTFFGLGPSGPVFPHDKHLEDVDCTSCHEGSEESAEAGFPASEKGCMLCHAEIDAKLPAERKVSAFLVDGKPRWLRRAKSYDGEVLFDHAKHFEAEVDCEACHSPQTDGKGRGLRLRGGKARCLECHAKTPRKNDCSVCHKVLRHDQMPPDHSRNWKRSHGAHSRQVLIGTGGTTCEQCHQPRSCDRCHQQEAPFNHTNSWRGRSHGLVASIDRTSCTTCHRPDYCVRCHNTTAPRSHRGTFGAPRNNHCVGCHVQSVGQGCGTCHRGFPVHSPGTPLPGNMAHLVANSPIDCLTCHLGLKHANPGLDCRACHR